MEPQAPITHADIALIQRMIPHRYPFLFIDEVRDIVVDKSCTGIKNVTMNEPQFQGHFPSKPIMPGVLIVEAMAQTSAVLVVSTLGSVDNDDLVYFMTIDKCKFRKLVQPGDVLELFITKIKQRGRIWRFLGEAKVRGQLAAEAEFQAMIVPPEEQ